MTQHPTGGIWTCSECLDPIAEDHICPTCYAITCEACSNHRHHKPTFFDADPDKVGVYCPNIPDEVA